MMLCYIILVELILSYGGSHKFLKKKYASQIKVPVKVCFDFMPNSLYSHQN